MSKREEYFCDMCQEDIEDIEDLIIPEEWSNRYKAGYNKIGVHLATDAGHVDICHRCLAMLQKAEILGIIYLSPKISKKKL